MEAGTKQRVPDSQAWPAKKKVPKSAPSTATERSASSQMMVGLFPPSSRVTFLMVSAASFMTRRPVSVEPVKATLSTIGFEHSSSPTSGPDPTTTLKTPGGMPASAAAFASSSAVSGVSLAGLRTMELPMMRAGATFQTAIMKGRFHGMIPAHTPMGSRLTKFHDIAGTSIQGSGS